MPTLSAPARSSRSTSSGVRTPPPTVSGMKHLLGGAGDDVVHGGAVVGGGGDVEEGQLVGAGRVIGGGELDGVARVAQVLEVHALDDSSRVHVQAGDHTHRNSHAARLPCRPSVSSAIFPHRTRTCSRCRLGSSQKLNMLNIQTLPIELEHCHGLAVIGYIAYPRVAVPLTVWDRPHPRRQRLHFIKESSPAMSSSAHAVNKLLQVGFYPREIRDRLALRPRIADRSLTPGRLRDRRCRDRRRCSASIGVLASSSSVHRVLMLQRLPLAGPRDARTSPPGTPRRPQVHWRLTVGK